MPYKDKGSRKRNGDQEKVKDGYFDKQKGEFWKKRGCRFEKKKQMNRLEIGNI